MFKFPQIFFFFLKAVKDQKIDELSEQLEKIAKKDEKLKKITQDRNRLE